jgi:hypothetical protein
MRHILFCVYQVFAIWCIFCTYSTSSQFSVAHSKHLITGNEWPHTGLGHHPELYKTTQSDRSLVILSLSRMLKPRSRETGWHLQGHAARQVAQSTCCDLSVLGGPYWVGTGKTHMGKHTRSALGLWGLLQV